MKHTVENIVQDSLCISCGLCASVCHKKAITYNKFNGMYTPVINKEDCVSCGICFDICPGKGCEYGKLYEGMKTIPPNNLWIGNCKESFTASSKGITSRQNGTSGGVVTSIVEYLLGKRLYDGAFLVDTHRYDSSVNTVLYKIGDNLDNTAKSRYIPVMHTNAVDYILKHREERIILVGVPCFVQGFLNIIQKYALNRDNYFIIGLFCDRTMNYNIYSYFDRFCAPKRINQLYFRDKSKNGWPGDILIECEDNSTVYLPRNKRTAVKEYFTPERCLYCLDKLNQFADISLGDNYTGKDEVQYGSNSVIVRTEKGSYHFHKAIDDDIIDAFEANVSDIVISQKINNRIDNLKNQNSKESVFLIRNPEFVSCKGNVKNAKYDRLLSMLKLGSSADFEAIDQEVKKSIKKRNNLANRMKRILRKIKIKLGI